MKTLLTSLCVNQRGAGQIEKFINDAPDGNKAEKRGQREQVTVTFDTIIISQLDDLDQHEGISRAAQLRMAVRQLLEKGAQVGGQAGFLE